jgi:hypothetical protein
MKTKVITLSIIFCLAIGVFNVNDTCGGGFDMGHSKQERQAQLANCLTEKGWALYSSFTCPACRSQSRAFGEAFEFIKEIECNPNAPNNQVELCLKMKIKKTPTWILEKNGEEVKRIESYQLLEDLASVAECEF